MCPDRNKQSNKSSLIKVLSFEVIRHRKGSGLLCYIGEIPLRQTPAQVYISISNQSKPSFSSPPDGPDLFLFVFASHGFCGPILTPFPSTTEVDSFSNHRTHLSLKQSHVGVNGAFNLKTRPLGRVYVLTPLQVRTKDEQRPSRVLGLGMSSSPPPFPLPLPSLPILPSWFVVLLYWRCWRQRWEERDPWPGSTSIPLSALLYWPISYLGKTASMEYVYIKRITNIASSVSSTRTTSSLIVHLKQSFLHKPHLCTILISRIHHVDSIIISMVDNN